MCASVACKHDWSHKRTQTHTRDWSRGPRQIAQHVLLPSVLGQRRTARKQRRASLGPGRRVGRDRLRTPVVERQAESERKERQHSARPRDRGRRSVAASRPSFLLHRVRGRNARNGCLRLTRNPYPPRARIRPGQSLKGVSGDVIILEVSGSPPRPMGPSRSSSPHPCPLTWQEAAYCDPGLVSEVVCA